MAAVLVSIKVSFWTLTVPHHFCELVSVAMFSTSFHESSTLWLFQGFTIILHFHHSHLRPPLTPPQLHLKSACSPDMHRKLEAFLHFGALGFPPEVWVPSRVVDRIAQALRFRGCGLRLRLPGFGLRGSGFGGWGLGGLPREPRRRGPKPFLDPQLSDLRERPA